MEANAKYESIIEDLINNHYAVVDDFFDTQVLSDLKTQLLLKIISHELDEASIGNKQQKAKNQTIRTDKIKWIEADSPLDFEQSFHQQIKQFYQYLNQTCYTGIQHSEFHYAHFAKGAYYKRHLDRFKNDNARKFSMVTYLNNNWHKIDGGNLMIYTDAGDVSVLPIWGRTVIFKSDILEHEVMVARKDRLSVTGWLK